MATPASAAMSAAKLDLLGRHAHHSLGAWRLMAGQCRRPQLPLVTEVPAAPLLPADEERLAGAAGGVARTAQALRGEEAVMVVAGGLREGIATVHRRRWVRPSRRTAWR